MQKLKKPLMREFPPVKLYLDDLRAISDVLKQKATDIKITTADYEVEDINQLRDLEAEEIHLLSIKCSSPYINMEFYPGWIRVYFGEDSTYNRGILAEIEEIISKRRVFLGSFFASNWAMFIIGLVGGSLIFGINRILEKGEFVWLVISVVVILYAIFVLKSFLIGLRNYSTIVCAFKEERSSFWKRNRDQILIAIISAVVGSLLTVAALWIFKSLE